MINYTKQTNIQIDALFNSILILCRDPVFYTKFDLIDTFQNRIHLIFIHISFIFIKIKQNDKNKIYKIFLQEVSYYYLFSYHQTPLLSCLVQFY